jgi:hypothetical protein
METPQEFLMKYGICSDTTIGIEGDKKLTELLEEYANQALHIHDVSGQLPNNLILYRQAKKLDYAEFCKWINAKLGNLR